MDKFGLAGPMGAPCWFSLALLACFGPHPNAQCCLQLPIYVLSPAGFIVVDRDCNRMLFPTIWIADSVIITTYVISHFFSASESKWYLLELSAIIWIKSRVARMWGFLAILRKNLGLGEITSLEKCLGKKYHLEEFWGFYFFYVFLNTQYLLWT